MIALKTNRSNWGELLNDYGLSNDFDVDGLLNLVPSHRHCNLQKKGQILPKSTTLHFLSIAEGRYDKACKIEAGA